MRETLTPRQRGRALAVTQPRGELCRQSAGAVLCVQHSRLLGQRYGNIRVGGKRIKDLQEKLCRG